jgi:hypothetical protein
MICRSAVEMYFFIKNPDPDSNPDPELRLKPDPDLKKEKNIFGSTTQLYVFNLQHRTQLILWVCYD